MYPLATKRGYRFEDFVSEKAVSKDVTAVCRVRDDDSFISSRVEMVGESVDVETGGRGQRVHLDGVAR